MTKSKSAPKEYLIYGRSSCPYTQRALAHAKTQKLKHKYVDVTQTPMSKSHKATVKRNNHSTVPAVFVSIGNSTKKRYKFVGGSDRFAEC